MKSLKNLDVKKTKRANNKIFFAILFSSILLLTICFPIFVCEHPGLIGVLVAVSGEVYFDWKEERGQHARHKKFFMALLVVSLTYELYEASESDKKAANAIKLAGDASERASKNELQVAALTNETVRVSLQLEETKLQLANANIKLAKIKNAIPPRTIPEKQRELFIAALLETNAVMSPKIDIKVFVQDTDDQEAQIFADSVRKMLNEAGYGTNRESVIKIQPFEVVARDQNNQRMPQIFAIFATDYDGKIIPLSMPGMGGCFWPMLPTKNSVQYEIGNPKFPMASYFSNSPSDILGGIRNVLNYIGLSTMELSTPTNLNLKPYEVGLYIPPQVE